MLSPSLLAKIESWSIEASQRERGRVDAALVHKAKPENVAIARFDRYDPENPDDRCVAEILVDQNHPYFFEHPVDHVPGLLLVEAFRQAGIATSHELLGVPIDAAMIVDSFEAAFTRYAELDHPLFVALLATDKGYRGERLTSARLSGTFVQGGEVIGTAVISARLVWWARG